MSNGQQPQPRLTKPLTQREKNIMRSPDTYRAYEIKDWTVQERRIRRATGHEYWQPARPDPYYRIGFFERVRTAWRVITGEFDALDWNDRGDDDD